MEVGYVQSVAIGKNVNACLLPIHISIVSIGTVMAYIPPTDSFTQKYPNQPQEKDLLMARFEFIRRMMKGKDSATTCGHHASSLRLL